MRGLDDPTVTRPAASRYAPRVIILIFVAAVLLITLLLPNKAHLSAWTETTVNSVYGYMGWKPLSTASLEAEKIEEAPAKSELIVTSAMILNTSLPACTRTFLFPITSGTGFTGQLGLIIRAAVVAEALGYTFLLDDGQWIYGRWTDYFAPFEPDCMPADDWQDLHKRKQVSPKTDGHWRQANHVWGPRSVSYLDYLTLSQIMSYEDLNKLHLQDLEAWPPTTPIASNDTVPAYFVDVFRKQAQWAERLWKMSPELEKMVEEERDALGWDLPGWDDRQRNVPSDVVIGAHVRMGDKCHETNALKAGPLRFAEQLLGHKSEKTMHGEKCTHDGKLLLDDKHAQNYFDAAAAEVNAILSEHSGRGIPATPDYDTSKWGDSKPTLLVMSDEVAVLKAIQAHAGSKVFRLLHTINADVSGLEHGFNGYDFMALSIEDRVKATRPMVRDMELLSRHAGGLVFMSISNVGRMLALLPGLREVQSGRIMAVDNRWFPTCFFN